MVTAKRVAALLINCNVRRTSGGHVICVTKTRMLPSVGAWFSSIV
jgi:hypothetical protein